MYTFLNSSNSDFIINQEKSNSVIPEPLLQTGKRQQHKQCFQSSTAKHRDMSNEREARRKIVFLVNYEG